MLLSFHIWLLQLWNVAMDFLNVVNELDDPDLFLLSVTLLFFT